MTLQLWSTGGSHEPPALSLYPPQQSAVSAIEELMGPGIAVMMTLATGGGKTEIAIDVASRRWRVLFVAPTVTVAEQTADRFKGYGFKAECLRSTEFPDVWPADLNVITTTTSTASRRGIDLLPAADLVIVDEAHHAADDPKQPKGLTKFVGEAKAHDCEVLGITATCWRLSKKDGFNLTWDYLVQRETLPQLVRDGYLVPLVLELPPDGNTIINGGTGGNMDYVPSQIELLNATNPIFTERLIQWWYDRARHPDGRLMKTMTYAVSQYHAIRLANLAAQLSDAKVGLMASGMDGMIGRKVTLKYQRETIEIDVHPDITVGDFECLSGLRNGTLNNVVNVAKAIEGVDVTDLDCVLNGRSTKSHTLYRQLTGRAARRAEGKVEGLILDGTDNFARLGHPMQHTEYSLLPRAGTEGGGEAPTRPCEGADGTQCGQRLYAAQQECPVCETVQGDLCKSCGKFKIWPSLEEIDGVLRCKNCVEGEYRERRAKQARLRGEVDAEFYCTICKSPKIKGKNGGLYCWHSWKRTKRIGRGRSAWCKCDCNCWKGYGRRAYRTGAGGCCDCLHDGRVCGCNGGLHEVLRKTNEMVGGSSWEWALPDGSADCAYSSD